MHVENHLNGVVFQKKLLEVECEFEFFHFNV